MAIVQPGQVPTYTPSPAVSLSGYVDTDRTRLLFNGTQFVKARLDLARPDFAWVGRLGGTLAQVVTNKNYVSISGKQILVDGSRQEGASTGAPDPEQAQFILVGFPVPVGTNIVVLWSTTHLDYFNFFKVDYTFDDPAVISSPFYFSAGVSSVTEEFDFTESKYKYTITLDSTYSAKYFRIHAAASTAATGNLSAGTVNVDSTDGFPDSVTDGSAYASSTIIAYTGKTATSFTGVSGASFIFVGTVISFRPNFAHLITEVEIGTSYTPLLEFWNTNGTSATSRTLDDDFYYDITYDKTEDVYYTIRYNESATGTAGASFVANDDFSSTAIDTVRWEEDEVENNFQPNSTSGTLVYANSGAPGRITTKYYLDGDFSSQVNVGFNNVTSSGASVSLRAIDYENNNMFVQMGFVGPWRLTDVKNGDWEAVHAELVTDTTGDTASFYNLRLLSNQLTEGSATYTFTYDDGINEWAVTDDIGGSHDNLSPGTDYTSGPLTLSIAHSGVVPNGAVLALRVNDQHHSLPVDTAWDWKLGLEKSGDSYICKYDEGSGFVNLVTFTNSFNYGARLELFADGDNDTVDLAMDDFTVTGSIVFPTIHVLSIEAVDSVGNVVTISGVTDGDGFLIRELDIINDDSDYNAFTGGRVQLTTDGAASGNIFVKFKGDLYKYSKSTLPLNTEDGSSASVYKSSVIPEVGAEAFSYNGFSGAGLCYVEYDSERSGTYLKTVSTTTLSGTEYESYLDVVDADYPFAWDVNNYTIMYYVEGTNLKEYDMDENDVAFCNVVADDKIMSAGTSDTTGVTATVLNVYGQPLSSKPVTFVVTAGAGAVSPSSDCTNASGIATTTYTVGDTVGTITITATASDAACV